MLPTLNSFGKLSFYLWFRVTETNYLQYLLTQVTEGNNFHLHINSNEDTSRQAISGSCQEIGEVTIIFHKDYQIINRF